jgi:hypothetical protein
LSGAPTIQCGGISSAAHWSHSIIAAHVPSTGDCDSVNWMLALWQRQTVPVEFVAPTCTLNGVA